MIWGIVDGLTVSEAKPAVARVHDKHVLEVIVLGRPHIFCFGGIGHRQKQGEGAKGRHCLETTRLEETQQRSPSL